MKENKRNLKYMPLLLLLFVPLAGNLFLAPKIFSPLENRMLSKELVLDGKIFSSGVLAERSESFVQDQFPGRDVFIDLKSDVQTLLGKKENNGAYLGRDGYVFEEPPNGDEKILKDNIDAMMKLKEALREKFSLLLVPSSSVVLDERLPDLKDNKEEKEDFYALFNHMEGDKSLDLLSLLKDPDEQVYFRTDHHWTPDGAYLAYFAYIRSLGLLPLPKRSFIVDSIPDFLGTRYAKYRGSFVKGESFTFYDNMKPERFTAEYTGENKTQKGLLRKEKLKTHDKYAAFLGGNYPLIRITRNDGKGAGKLLVLKDSFANAMAPFLAETFREVHYMDLRYYNLSLSDYLEKEDFTHVLLIYGADSFKEEKSLSRLKY